MSARGGELGGVPTIAALRAIDITSVQANNCVVVVDSAAGDQLGGVFYWSSASTAVDDGINYILPNSAPATGRWLRVQAGSVPMWTTAGGTGDAITATYPVPALTLYDGLALGLRLSAANTISAPTFAPNALTARAITKLGGQSLAAGELYGSLTEVLLRYNLANTRWEILNPARSAAMAPGGRLTLTAATPYMTATVTGATTIYYTPAVHGWVPIYNGTGWGIWAFSEVSQLTTDNTKSPAACTTNSNYDLFVWNDAGTIRCTRGPLWTSATARGTGAGTTQISQVNGIWTNTVAITNGPGAGLGTYVGTIRTDASSQVNIIFGGTGASGGEACTIALWNAYNQSLTCVNNFDTADSWTYNTATYRVKNNNANNEISFICGLAGQMLEAANTVLTSHSIAGTNVFTGIGLDSTVTLAAGARVPVISAPVAAYLCAPISELAQPQPLGFHFVAPIEAGNGATSIFYGDDAVASIKSTFSLKLWC